MKKVYYKLIKINIILIILSVIFSGCDDILEKQPLDALAEGTFWQTEKDATLALIGIYNSGRGRDSYNFQNAESFIRLDCTTDNGYEKDNRITQFNNGELESTHFVVESFWANSYAKIARCNVFLKNIGSVEMDEGKKLEITAEVKFIRALNYFWMSQFWGGVPLVTDVLTMEEANNVLRDSKENVVNFVLSELTECVANLPQDRPDNEFGRVTKAAALAIKGRLLMAEKRWSEAVEVYGSIMTMGIYGINPDFKDIFEDDGEVNNEVIFPLKYAENDYPTEIQRACRPFMYGGWHQINVYNELVKDFPCIDGLPVNESPFYDPSNPYDNRDPRLHMTVLIPERTVFKGQLYVAHPDSMNASDRLPRRDWSGYALLKFLDEDYEGSVTNNGADFPMVRYPEVLLSYLESKIEAGDAISQDLLDKTINLIRGRASVNLPAITQTNPDLLRPIVRTERRIELAFEGLRLFDLYRWRTAHTILNGKFYGMKLTNDPQNYTDFIVDDEGYFFCEETNFRENVDYLWPIPQSERDINQNLEQNPGY
ncbi:MAG: RagB/SusD family nutrient uptake outer membrane protein [Prolixibacteraceae bacterium]|nr:RagB/SusD family nutrient uptake outer membrane protein [Prolixibacteraceae bacterium]MBN2775123.1 RagB/SusD family nutrient uptake outer membrane protein [Prolixibacteraceae bacterium]